MKDNQYKILNKHNQKAVNKKEVKDNFYFNEMESLKIIKPKGDNLITPRYKSLT